MRRFQHIIANILLAFTLMTLVHGVLPHFHHSHDEVEAKSTHSHNHEHLKAHTHDHELNDLLSFLIKLHIHTGHKNPIFVPHFESFTKVFKNKFQQSTFLFETFHAFTSALNLMQGEHILDQDMFIALLNYAPNIALRGPPSMLLS